MTVRIIMIKTAADPQSLASLKAGRIRSSPSASMVFSMAVLRSSKARIRVIGIKQTIFSRLDAGTIKAIGTKTRQA